MMAARALPIAVTRPLFQGLCRRLSRGIVNALMRRHIRRGGDSGRAWPQSHSERATARRRPDCGRDAVHSDAWEVGSPQARAIGVLAGSDTEPVDEQRTRRTLPASGRRFYSQG